MNLSYQRENRGKLLQSIRGRGYYGYCQIKKAKGQTTHYAFRGTEPIFEKQVTTGKTKSYVYALGKYLARVDGVIGDPKANKYFYHTDHIGSIRAITDQAGEVVYKADYFTFGTQFSKDGDFEELHGFTGKEYDPDIGLYYFNARWYDPDLARFISEDSARDPDNPNLYSYCGNNPVMRVDPTGKFWWIAIGAILGGLDAHLCGGDFMQGFMMGAVTGAIGAGVGSALGNTAWGVALANSSQLGFQVVSGAIGGGIIGEFFGEGFEEGAKSGAITAAISWGVNKRFGKFAIKNKINYMLINGLKGGLNALVSGKDFVEAFAYGFAYGFTDSPELNGIGETSTNTNGPTPTESLEISDHVYDAKESDKGKEVLPGWILVDVYIEGGLKMGVYKRVEAVGANGKPDIVIANKGTTTLRDWLNNLGSIFGLSPDAKHSIEYAMNFVENHSDANITFVGHSKGGAEAAYNAIATNRNAVLFNPAPINQNAYGLGQNSLEYNKTMTAYIVKGEILGLLSNPTSNVIPLPRQSWNPITNHLMDSVRNAMTEHERRYKIMSKIVKIVLVVCVALICSYQVNIKAAGKGEYRITNIRIYKNTPAWKLALAVKRQNTGSIKRIAKKEPQLLNYQDPKYGATLLLWAVGTERYRSAEALLKCGADPEIASTGNTAWGGDTPLLVASGFSWVDRFAKKNPKYVKLLLQYEADPNKPYAGFNIPEGNSLTEPGTSPLMQSIGCGIEKTKALVEAGADIDYKIKRGTTAATVALNFKWMPEYAYYLIVQKKARISEPYYRRISIGNEDPNEKLYPVDLLRYWVFDLDSKEYKMKMEIVEEFERQGVNYWETEINSRTLETIKIRYPDTWEEYIKKY